MQFSPGNWRLRLPPCAESVICIRGLLCLEILGIVLIVALESFMNAAIHTAAAVYFFNFAACIAVITIRIR